MTIWLNVLQRVHEWRTFYEDCLGKVTPLEARKRIVQIEPCRRKGSSPVVMFEPKRQRPRGRARRPRQPSINERIAG